MRRTESRTRQFIQLALFAAGLLGVSLGGLSGGDLFEGFHLALGGHPLGPHLRHLPSGCLQGLVGPGPRPLQFHHVRPVPRQALGRHPGHPFPLAGMLRRRAERLAALPAHPFRRLLAAQSLGEAERDLVARQPTHPQHHVNAPSFHLAPGSSRKTSGQHSQRRASSASRARSVGQPVVSSRAWHKNAASAACWASPTSTTFWLPGW